MALRRLVGQRLMVGFIGLTPPKHLLLRVRRGEVGGVILFGRNIAAPDQVRSLTSRLQHAARQGGSPPLLVAVDQEGGAVRRFGSAPPARSAAAIGATGDVGVARRSARATGHFLRTVGVNLDFAPVADLGLPGGFVAAESRAFGADPAKVGRFARAFTRGLHQSRVWATAKHFPGLGAARVSTDYAPAVLHPTRPAFWRGLAPYRGLIADHVDVVMMSMAAFPAIDPSARPAAMSPVMYDLLRRKLGFRGLTVTDSLAAPIGLSGPAAGLRAVRAGADVLLYADSGEGGYGTLLRAARTGHLARPALTYSYARIVAAKQRLGAAGIQ